MSIGPPDGPAEPVYKVAHLLPWPGVGGTEHATLRIARAVEPHGFRSVAFCLPTAVPVLTFFRDAGIPTATWQQQWPHLRDMRTFIPRVVRLARELRRRRIDLVHCADVWAANSTAACAAKLAGLPVLCHVRNRQEELSRVDQRCLRAVDRFAFVSRDTWRRFAYPVSPQRGVVLYDGIDVLQPADGAGVREELGIAANARIVGMVARVEPQKDFATLADAARRVIAAEPDTHFLIVGGTDRTEEQRAHFREVLRWMEAQGIAGQVTFAGFRSDVARMLGAMDVFVLSTHWEGLPLVILEAMAQAKPVVATAVDGIPEVIAHGETGLLYAHEDAAMLADHILYLLRDPNRARGLGEAGRRYVAVCFSTERFAAAMVSLYRAVLGLGPAAAPPPTDGERPCPG